MPRALGTSDKLLNWDRRWDHLKGSCRSAGCGRTTSFDVREGWLLQKRCCQVRFGDPACFAGCVTLGCSLRIFTSGGCWGIGCTNGWIPRRRPEAACLPASHDSGVGGHTLGFGPMKDPRIADVTAIPPGSSCCAGPTRPARLLRARPGPSAARKGLLASGSPGGACRGCCSHAFARSPR